MVLLYSEAFYRSWEGLLLIWVILTDASANNKMKIYKIKIWASITSINLTRFILIFVENYLEYVATHYFSVWLRTGSYQADINRL